MNNFKVETIAVDNDLKVTTYPVSHPAVHEVVRLCDEYLLLKGAFRTQDTPLVSTATYTCIVKVELLLAEIYLVMSITPPTAGEVKRILRHGGINGLLENIMYLIYKGRVCQWEETRGKYLTGSIKARVSPEIYPLLTDSPATKSTASP
jgi:hypothetical protein